MNGRGQKLAVAVVLLAGAVMSLCAFGTRRQTSAMPAFLPKGAPTYHVVLPAKFGAGSTTVYVWKGSYQDTVDAAQRELAPKGWTINHLGTDQTLLQGEGHVWIVKGRILNPQSTVDGAKVKSQALSPMWAFDDYVSVAIDREDGSFIDHSRGLIFETFGWGR